MKRRSGFFLIVLAIICATALVAAVGVTAKGKVKVLPGTFSGTTSQGQSLSLTVSARNVTSFSTSFTTTCSDGLTRTRSVSITSLAHIKKNGKFSVAGTFTNGGTYSVAGKVKGKTGKKMKGSFSRQGSIGGGVTCNATVSWHAKHP